MPQATRRVPAKKNPFLPGYVQSAGFTVGAEDTNAITVNVQLKDKRGQDASQRLNVRWYLAGDAAGDTLTGTAADSVAAGTDGMVNTTTTGKAGNATCEADGDIDFVITYASGALTVYLVLVMPDGTLVVSGAITFA